MKKIIVLIVSCLFAIQIQAQISGYLGKRFSIIYSPSISLPHISLVAFQGSGSTLSLSIQNTIKFEYIVKKHMALGLRYKYAFNNAKNSDLYEQYIGFTENYKFQSHTGGFYFKFYGKNVLAPLGVYFALGFNFQYISLNNLILPEYNSSSTVVNGKYSSFDFAPSATWGKNWIVGNSLLIGFEGEVMPPLASIGKKFLGNGGYYYNDQNYSEVMQGVNLSSEILKLSVNIGFLAF